MTDDGVHSVQSEEGRSAVDSINSPRLWKVLVSYDSGLSSQRASSRPPAKTGNGLVKIAGVDVHTKTASDANVKWLKYVKM